MNDPVQNQLAAYNAHDVDAFMENYTDDCIVEDGQGNRLLTGALEMRPRYAALFAASPNLHAEVVKRIRIGEHVVDEEIITGRNPDLRHAVAIYHLRVVDTLYKIDHVRFYRETT
jgi:hypothetical protein